MNETKKPKIRFAEFGNEWEQRKFGEIFEEYSEKNHMELPALTIVQGEGTICRDESDRSLLYDKANLSNYKMVKEGDFIVHLRSFEGGLEIATNTGLISPAYHTFHGENTDSRFYYSYFRSKKFIDTDLKPHVYGIRDGRSIDIEGMKTIKIPYTSYDEQTAIGTYIAKFDNLITLSQRKYDRLVCVKKSMLEKMFPKDGADVPEVRFKGFTGVWERSTLENYLSVSNEKNTSDTYDKTDVLSVSGDYGIVNQIEFQGRSFAGVSVSNYGIVHTGDVVYTKSPLNSNPYGIIKTNKGKTGIVSTLYAVYHTKTNAFPDFVQVYFEQHARMNNYMHPLVNKGAKNDMKVSAENALKGTVIFPSYNEQKTISNFFAKLDNLISLQRQELEKLQSIKKALLEKMFV